MIVRQKDSRRWRLPAEFPLTDSQGLIVIQERRRLPDRRKAEYDIDDLNPETIISKRLIDVRISELNKYLDNIRGGDIVAKFKWRSKLTNWLESEGMSRQVAYNFSSSLYLGTQCSDNHHEVVVRAMIDNEEINQFFKSWLEKSLGGQTEQ